MRIKMGIRVWKEEALDSTSRTIRDLRRSIEIIIIKKKKERKTIANIEEREV